MKEGGSVNFLYKQYSQAETIGQLLFSVDMSLAPQDDRFGNPEISSPFTECEI